MSEQLIASLQKRVDELTNENATLRSENRDRRIKSKHQGEELEALQKEHETAVRERDELKSKVDTTPKELQAKVDELTGQIRHRDHRDAFAAVTEFEGFGKDGKATKYKLADGVKPEAVWQLTGYKAEGETPDAKVVAVKYSEARASHPYLFSEATVAPDGATRPTPVQSREAGPGGGKGTSQTLAASQGGQTSMPANYIPGKI